jgi:predicted porin
MTAVFASNNNYNDRIANTIYYATPDFGGITAAISYSLGENKDTPVVGVGAGNTTSMNVMYAGGPLFVGFGYQTQKTTAASISEKYSQLNASYDLKVVKLLGAYGRVANSGAVQDNNVREWLIGADFPVSSALTISGGYARSTLTVPGAQDQTGKAYSLAATYSLSKRTTVYGGFESDTYSQTGVADVDRRKVGAGVKHAF